MNEFDGAERAIRKGIAAVGTMNEFDTFTIAGKQDRVVAHYIPASHCMDGYLTFRPRADNPLAAVDDAFRIFTT